MSRIEKVISRVGSLVVVAACLSAAAHGGPSKPMPGGHEVWAKRDPGRFVNGRPDTTIIYGDSTFTRGSSGTSTTYTSSFSADTSGWRHVLQIWNGSGGANRVSGGAISLNGFQILSSTDLNSSVDYVSRVIAPIPTNTLLVTLQGTAGTFIKARIIRMPNPKYNIFGPYKFARTNISQTQSTGFHRPSGAAGPYTLRMDNGEPDGSHRIWSAYTMLNWGSILVPSDFGAGVASREREVSLNPDSNTVSSFIYYPDYSWKYVTITATDTTAPALHIAWPPQNYVTDSTRVRFAGWTTDETKGLTSVNGQTGALNPGAFADSVTFSADGRFDIHVVSTNAAGYATDSIRIIIRAQAPSLVVTQPAASISTTTSSSTTLAGNWIALTNVTVTANGDTLPSGTPTGTFSKTVTLALGANTLTVRARDGYGHASVVTRTVIYEPAGSGAAEPTPSTIAVTQVDDFRSETAFLYGPGGPQIGPDTSTFDRRRTAVILGRVVQATDTADTLSLAHVRVRVVGHPEYGYTDSRATGNYDLVVNGGGQLTLEFTRSGFATARRVVTVPIRDYVRVDDLALKGFDTKQVAVNLTQGGIASGSRIDEAGQVRASTLMFKAGTQATGVPAGGGSVPLGSTLTVRATEYSVGPEGPRRMPAPLPVTSAYTHCVNLTAMEAENLGITQVTFSQPVAYYVENFLSLPVGTKVPVGSYTPEVGWKGEEDGRVIKILGTSGGSATLDVTGDDVADSGTALTDLGIDSSELQQIAQAYRAGQSVWRSRLTHFSDWDWNFPFWWPFGAISPNGGWPFWLQLLLADCFECPGSVIEAENQTLREEIPVVGTTYALHYSSARASGNRRPYQVRIPLRKGNVPREVTAILWTLDIAGRHYGDRIQNFTDFPGNSSAPEYVDMEWNGLDGFGRPIVGSRNAHIRVGYSYQNAYGIDQRGGSGSSTWGNPPSGARLSTSTRGNEGIIWTEFDVALGTMRNEIAGLGGWSITPNHFYDFSGRGTLYRGDGTAQPGERTSPTLEVLNRGSNTPVFDVAYGPDGSLYYSESNGGIGGAGESIIKRRAPDGTITIKVGSSISADWTLPPEVAFVMDPAGNFYVAEPANNRVREFLTDGTSRIVAGTLGANEETGDGGPAAMAHLRRPSAIALGADGTLYVADRDANTIRRIAPDGVITRFAGTGSTSPIVDVEARADSIPLSILWGRIRVGPRGDLYVADQGHNRVRRVSPDGVNHTIAIMPYPTADVAIAPEGVPYVATGIPTDFAANGVYRLEPGQPAVQVAGTPSSPYSLGSPGRPALTVFNNRQSCIAFNRDGELVIGQFGAGGCFLGLMRPVFPGFTLSENVVVSGDASEKYVFDISGRHLRTLDGLTGGTRFVFRYQGYGSGNVRLMSIRDMNGDSTVVHRDGQGQALDITSPDGHQTALTVAAGNVLSEVTNPTTQETVRLFIGGGGLIDSLRDARGYSHQFQYESDGRLRRDLAADGFSTTLTAASLPDSSLPDRSVAAVSALNRSFVYAVDFRDARQTEIRSSVGPDNLVHEIVRRGDASVTSSSPDGTKTRYRPGVDPQFGVQAAFPESLLVARPSGTSSLLTTTSFSREPNYGALSEAVAVNGRSYQQTFTPGSGGGGTIVSRPPSGSGRQVTATIDSVGRALITAFPGNLGQVVAHYDSRGRVDTLRVNGRRWEYHYEDARGRLTRIRDPLNRETTFSYDGADRLVQQVMPGGADTAYFGYDQEGNVTSIKPPGGSFHRFALTPGGLTRQYDPPDVAGIASDSTHIELNVDRAPTSISLPGGVSLTMGYDAAGRLATLSQPRGATTVTYKPSGDGAGQVASVLSPDGVELTFDYDGGVRTGSEWDYGDATTGGVAYQYDGNLWPIHEVVSGTSGAGSDVQYGYDVDGLITSASLIGGTSLLLKVNATTGLLDSSRASGVSQRYGYNQYAELTSSAAWYGTDTLYSVRYRRDDLGRVVHSVEVVPAGTTERGYGYDSRGRLISVRDSLAHGDVARYRYDANGNRLGLKTASDSLSAAFDSQDRIVDQGSTHYLHAPSGARASRNDTRGTLLTAYDLMGNLLKVKLVSGDSVEYIVDGLNRRVGRKLNGVLTDRWVYRERGNIVAELSPSGVLRKRFIYGTRAHVPDVMIAFGAGGATSTYRLITDALGSVQAVVDVNTGLVAQRLAYDEWGRVVSDTQPGFQPFGFAGGLYDSHTALDRFGARDYDPETGTWLSKDPAGFRGETTNMYQYAFSSPLNYVDPSGLASLEFDRQSGRMRLYDGSGRQVADWPAGNNTTRPGANPNTVNGNGPAPNGTYQLNPPIEITDPAKRTSYGSYFFPIGKTGPNKRPADLVRRRGIGVHAGRLNHSSKTLGCIRLDNGDEVNLALWYLYQQLVQDPITDITIR